VGGVGVLVGENVGLKEYVFVRGVGVTDMLSEKLQVWLTLAEGSERVGVSVREKDTVEVAVLVGGETVWVWVERVTEKVPSDAVGVGLAVREPVAVSLIEIDLVCVVENVDVGEWVKVCVGLQVGVHVRE